MKALCQHRHLQVSGQMGRESIRVLAVFLLGIEVEVPRAKCHMKRGIVPESPTEGNVSPCREILLPTTSTDVH